MVTRIQVALDDGEFERVRDVKDELGLTWEQFLIHAADELGSSEE